MATAQKETLMSAQTGTSVNFANRFTPELVDLNAHGSSISATILIDGKYYTAINLRPDFTEPDGDAELALPETNREVMIATLRERHQAVGTLVREDRCEQWLINQVLENDQVVFSLCWRSYLEYVGLNDVEPSNRSYYDAMKTFVTVWHRLTNVVASA